MDIEDGMWTIVVITKLLMMCIVYYSYTWMIYLGITKKKNLRIRITKYGKNYKLRLSQVEYVENVLSRFNMEDSKPISTPLASQFKLPKEDFLKAKGDKD